MPEIRQDVTTKEWVIFATERAKRPEQFTRNGIAKLPPSWTSNCPFCPGNEEMTLSDLHTKTLSKDMSLAAWQVRVVPNMFPALASDGSLSRVTEGSLFHHLDGVGQHEVVIETPVHNRFLFDMDDAEIGAVVSAYRQRYRELKKDGRFKLILIFKNHGRSAGTSLEHPHSQIIATPVVPAHVRNRYEVATSYFDDMERCIYCDVVAEEIRLQKRLLHQTEHFVAFHPFASRVPFETWIAPLRHCSSFSTITDDEVDDLARTVRVVMKQMHAGLGSPDFNYIIQSAPLADEDKHYYLWHMQIIPRLTTTAGFELGSGMSINTALPEETAEFMRNVQIS